MQREAEATLTDRRRPGRIAAVNPNLLPLLRAGERALLPPLPEDEPSPGGRLVDTGPGVLIGVIGGAALWAAGIGAVWALAG